MYRLASFIEEYARNSRQSVDEVEGIIISYLQEQLEAQSFPRKAKSLSQKVGGQVMDIQKYKDKLLQLDKEFEANSEILNEIRDKYINLQRKNQILLEEKKHLDEQIPLLKKHNNQLTYDNQMGYAKVNSEKSNIKFVHIALIVFSILGVLLALIFSIFQKH